MTRQQIAALLEQAADWPEAAQQELVRAAAEIEKKHLGVYRLDDEERADIREALAEIERGEAPASEEEVRATFESFRRA